MRKKIGKEGRELWMHLDIGISAWPAVIAGMKTVKRYAEGKTAVFTGFRLKMC